MNERQKLLQKVQVYDFALEDISLFLDTHPQDREALAHYMHCMKLYKQAHAEYVERYGPLTQFDQQDGACWQWIDNPWPWEYER